MTYIVIDCRGWRADVAARKEFLCPDKSLAKCSGIGEREEGRGKMRCDERSHMPEQTRLPKGQTNGPKNKTYILPVWRLQERLLLIKRKGIRKDGHAPSFLNSSLP